MAIIVKHRKTGNEYILLHIGGGEDSTSFPSRLLPDLFPREQVQNSFGVTICDARGNIFSSYLDDLVVIEIDGKKPGEILPEPVIESIEERFEEDDEETWQQEDASVSDSPDDRAKELDNEDDEDWI